MSFPMDVRAPFSIIKQRDTLNSSISLDVTWAAKEKDSKINKEWKTKQDLIPFLVNSCLRRNTKSSLLLTQEQPYPEIINCVVHRQTRCPLQELNLTYSIYRIQWTHRWAYRTVQIDLKFLFKNETLWL